MNENTIELLGWYGSDTTHALSAWTSTSRELDEEKIKRIPQLLKYLADNEHGTPFEKSCLHFLARNDIATHIHCLKHRIAVPLNGESARYKELDEDKYYLPNDFPSCWRDELRNHTQRGLNFYHQCLKSLVEEYGFTRKRAKESARYFRTYNTQIDNDIAFNFRSFVHFQRLRNSGKAQKEVKEIAQEMLDLVKAIPDNPFQYSLAAFQL